MGGIDAACHQIRVDNQKAGQSIGEATVRRTLASKIGANCRYGYIMNRRPVLSLSGIAGLPAFLRLNWNKLFLHLFSPIQPLEMPSL